MYCDIQQELLKAKRHFGELATCLYHFDSLFRNTAHERAPKPRQLLYDAHHAVRPMRR